MKNSEHYGWSWKAVILFLLSHVVRSQCTTVRVEHSVLSIPLAHVGTAVEQAAVAELLTSHQHRVTRSSRLNSFIQRRRTLRVRSQGSLSGKLPLQNQYLPKRRISTYFGSIGIGNKPTSQFRVMFDTGSCEVWVPDNFCLTPTCLGRHKYTRSSSFQPLVQTDYRMQTIDVQYLSGGLRAYQAQDTIYLDQNITIANQTIDFATMLDIPLLQDIAWDGIVGLGFRNEDQVQRGTFPLISTLTRENVLTRRGLRNQFAYFLSPRGGANLELIKSGETAFLWAAVDPSTSYWGVKVTRVGSRGADTQPPNRSSVIKDWNFFGTETSIIDTGTYLIYAPKGAFSAALKSLADIMNDVTSCEKKKQALPVLSFIFAGLHNNTVEVFLRPSDYVLDYGGSDCALGIVEDDADTEDQLGGWTFGQIFLKAYYTVFDADVPAVGFTRLPVFVA